jgi:hypothetical protein
MQDWILDSLHQELERYKHFKINTINVKLYIELVEQIAKRGDPSSIPFLMAQFTDDPAYEEVLEATKYAIERYYTNVYVEVISKHIDILVKNAPEWACIFLFEIFQTPIYLDEFRNSILKVKTEEVVNLLCMMEERLDMYKEFVGELRARLK